MRRRTCGELRALAWKCYEAGKYAQAARRYRQALARYPNHHPKAQSAIDDKANMEQRIATYEALAQAEVAI